MYKLMIVEDDALYRRELRNIVEWERYGFSFIGEAMNGRDALEKMKQEIPDLILTDISMPEMDGIALIQTLKRDYPDLVCLVLSSYDDFAFVKDALKLGAEDYILKYTVTEEIMVSALLGIRDKLDARKKARDCEQLLTENLDKIADDYMKKALLDIPGAVQALPDLWRLLDLQGWPAGVCVICVRTGNMDMQDLQRLRGTVTQTLRPWEFFVPMEDDKIAIVLFAQHLKSRIALLEYIAGNVTRLVGELNRSGSKAYSIGVSNIRPAVELLPEAYRQAEFAQTQSFYDGAEKAYFYVNINKARKPLKLEDLREKIREDLQEAQFSLVRKELRDYIRQLNEARPQKAELQYEMLLLYDVLHCVAIEEKLDFSLLTGHRMVSERLLDGSGSLEEMGRHLSEAFERFFAEAGGKNQKGLQDSHSGNRYLERYIDRIMDFIDKNYMREISLNVLSEQMNLTPNYLCRLFRSCTGMKLTDYINRVRIEGAKKLLTTTDMKVYEVAESVGFASASYFCTVFKNITGVKVSEYKEAADI